MSLLEKGLYSPALKAFLHALEKRDPLLIEELWQTPKAFLAALAQKVTGSHLLIITSHSEEEGGLFHDLQFFTDSKCIDFPSWETLPNENIPPSPDIVGDRYRTLEVLLTEKTPQIILTNLQACLQKVLPPQRLKQLHVSVAKGAVIDFEGLVMQLDQMGYTRTPIVADKGEYAVRGGIIDVYSVAAPEPFRIEFWGDEVESIRLFDPIGQRTIRPVEMFSIPPAQELEMLNSGEDLATILDYLGNDTIVIF
ncbi:MAG: transcription-repair coupling factor, partial [Chlamydiia bacterium]|nr:transcription-repair coupling factor [Chlamydiia bacterium]